MNPILFIRPCPQCNTMMHMEHMESVENPHGVTVAVCQNDSCRKIWGPGALKAIANRNRDNRGWMGQV